MIRGLRAGRVWVALILVAALIGGAAVALGNRRAPVPLPPRPDKPTMLVVTSLPIIFAEQFQLGGGSPALIALEGRYRVEPINITDAASLKGSRLLLMAHPLAQPAEALVDLDHWVRDGGRLVLLADPKLDWPSDRPLGDKLRPPPAFADTGLLKHWRLTLYAPDQAGSVEREIDGRSVAFHSPGVLAGACRLSDEGLVARCEIGRGKATIIADADFLRADTPDSDSLQFLLAELDRIERN